MLRTVQNFDEICAPESDTCVAPSKCGDLPACAIFAFRDQSDEENEVGDSMHFTGKGPPLGALAVSTALSVRTQFPFSPLEESS